MHKRDFISIDLENIFPDMTSVFICIYLQRQLASSDQFSIFPWQF